jgi:undecaprenyl-diphosphatase
MTTSVNARPWTKAWPLTCAADVRLLGAGLGLLAVWSMVGLMFMWFLDDGAVGDADRRLSRWVEDNRTEMWNDLTNYGSMMSDTLTKVVLVAAFGGVMVVVWKRWHDAVFLGVAVIFESSVFVLTSFIVGRDRPPIEPLDSVPPSGSFPSGHTAAAVAFYGGLHVVTRWHTTSRRWRGATLTVGITVPLVVAASRTYRGMHHAIDVAAGAALGVATLVVVAWALRSGVAELDRGSRTGEVVYPAQTRRLSLVDESPALTDETDRSDHSERLDERIPV